MFKRVFRTLIWIGFTLGVICFLINAYMIHFAAQRIVPPNALAQERVDCIIVPGARVYEDGSPCAVLQDRLDAAIELYNAGVSDRLLLSGDHGTEGYDEVTAMKNYALEKGVREEDIFLDHAGFSTYETMYRAAAIYGADSCVVSTQNYHLYRALYLGERMNMRALGVEADRRSYPRMTYYQLREALARVKDFAFTIFKPRPTYLGSPIPLSGDGRITAKAPFQLPILAEGNH